MNLINTKKSVKWAIGFVIIGILLTLPVFGQLPDAQKVVREMKIGWNMGNTLEAICGETAWGGAFTSQKLIDSVKAAGFNAVRLPCAWFCHSDTITSEIDADWIARVKDVVDYCINADLYVILNAHWDKGWLENRVNSANQDQVNERQYAYWTQIANYFKEYDEHLLFASANEPNVDNPTGWSILLTYHQTFVDAVRATGGNNSSRTLVIQGPSTDIEKTYSYVNSLPTDVIANRLVVEVHYYTPWQFCGLESDANWGKALYYWGKDYHSTTDVTRNCTWGEESDVEKYFGYMKTKFVDKGIPVIIGEYMAIRRKLSEPSDQDLHLASVEHFYKYVVSSAVSKRIIPFCWDINKELFNRSTGAKLDTVIINAIMEGAKDLDTTLVAIHSQKSNFEIYPNPFESTININLNDPGSILRIVIFDMMGKQVESIQHSAIKSFITTGADLKPDMYMIAVYGINFTETFRVVKR